MLLPPRHAQTGSQDATVLFVKAFITFTTIGNGYLAPAMDYKNKTPMQWIDYVVYSIKNRGLMRTCTMGYSEWRKERELGINTFGTASPKDLSVVGDDVGGGHLYQPSSSVLFQQAIRALPIAPAESTFLDIGSGKGRAMILAAEAGFRKVIGIEYATELNVMARANLKRIESRFPTTTFDIHEGDALAFPIPADVHVIYLFNPFDENSLQQWAATIGPSLMDGMFIIYMHPIFAEALSSALKKVEIVFRSPDSEFIIYRYNKRSYP